jgi:hypothetical protein
MTAMLEPGRFPDRSNTVIPRQIIRTGITASAIAHLSILMLVIFFSEVHRFGSVTAEPITVDLVRSEEVPPISKTPEPPPEPKPQPSDSFELTSKSAASSSPPPATPPAAQAATPPAQPQKQTAASTPNRQQQASAQPQAQQQLQAQPQSQQQLQAQPQAQQQLQPQSQQQPPQQPPAAAPTPAYTPPQPDLSIKYHVMLGLPPALPVEPSKDKSDDNFDAPAMKAAEITSNIVTEFRRHLKTCSKLPGSIAPTDKIRITLRAIMTPEGKLAAEPILIEASASEKGPSLMQSAISALEACQPYAMLPADRYREWKVLDLSFTPQDFGGG